MSVFLYLDGIRQAAKAMQGDETIHMGIRPYAMHAGNTLAIIAYPILLCEELERQGKTPRLKFLLSLNDWEQASLKGEDIYKFTFDVQPEHSTIEHSFEDDGQPTAQVWGEKITEATQEITNRFPDVKIHAIRNSQLKKHEFMKQVIFKTIREKEALKDVLLRSSGRPTNNSNLYFANALCPNCKHANTNTAIQNDVIITNCQSCEEIRKGEYDQFSYWLHHKPLFAARWKIFGFSHSISGGDHFNEGDVETRKALYEFYFGKPAQDLSMIFSPILIADNGLKMSKSRQNHYSVDLASLLRLAKSSKSERLFSQDIGKEVAITRDQ